MGKILKRKAPHAPLSRTALPIEITVAAIYAYLGVQYRSISNISQAGALVYG